MRILKLTLQYDGTDYVGWQRQPNGVSIQELVERALEPIEGAPVTVVGAGRTDAGVHALGQVASVRLTSTIALDALARALNATLPADVRIVRAEEGAPDFHARFSARSKTYRYRIQQGRFAPPFDRRYVWTIGQHLDFAAMWEAATPLVGRHDFAAFQGSGSDVQTTERTVTACVVNRGWGKTWGCRTVTITIDISADGFLRHMVRNIAGTLVEVGLGRRTVESVAETLASRDRSRAGATAPAQGLFLVKVDYEQSG